MRFAIVLASWFLTGTLAVEGAEVTWIGVSSSSWSSPENWSGGQIPGPMDDTVIPAGTKFSAQLSGNVVLQSFKVNSGATLTIVGTNSGTTLTVMANSCNQGTIRFETNGSLQEAELATAIGVTFTNEGGGTLMAEGSSGSRWLSGEIINLGTIILNAEMEIVRDGTCFRQNGGSIEGIAKLEARTGATFEWNGGQISAEAVGVFGGHLEIPADSTGTGLIRAFGNSTFSGEVKIDQILTILGRNSGTTLTVTANSCNQGTIHLEANSGQSKAEFVTAVGVTFTNDPGGMYSFGGQSGFSSIAGEFTNLGTIVPNGWEMEIIGEGTIFRQNGGLIEGNGTLEARTGATFEWNGGQISAAAAGVFGGHLEIPANSTGIGLIRALGNSTFSGEVKIDQILTILGRNSGTTLTVMANSCNQGTIRFETNGSLQEAALSTAVGATFTNEGGALFAFEGQGCSTVAGEISNLGAMRIGANANAIWEGDWDHPSQASVEFDISSPFESGSLDINGNVTFDGELRVNLIGGYSPSSGTNFDLLFHSGWNDAISCGDLLGMVLGVGLRTVFVRLDDRFRLSIETGNSSLGDLDCSGLVDLIDLALMVFSFGSQEAGEYDGDTDMDEDVDLLDFANLQLSFSQ